MQENERESNLDLLRVLCCICVVVIHISSRFKAGITDPGVVGQLIINRIPTIVLLDTLPRFAVPCFVMLAGAFALGNDKNGNYRSYYRKTLKTIGIPTLLFSAMYVGCSMVSQMKLVIAGSAGISALLMPVKAWILGAPYYHMWYLYTMIGLYVLTPVVVRWRQSVSEKTIDLCAVVLLVLCTISGWTSQKKFYWDLGFTFCYSGYYVMGYVLRRRLRQKKSNWKSLACIIAALLAELVVTYIQYRHSIQGIAEEDEVYTLIGSFSPLIVLASVLLFAGFCEMKTKINCSWFAKRAFLVYLFHAGVLTRIIGRALQVDIAYCGLTILATAAVVLAVSFVLTLAYEWIWGQLERKWQLSQTLIDWVLPEK